MDHLGLQLHSLDKDLFDSLHKANWNTINFSIKISKPSLTDSKASLDMDRSDLQLNSLDKDQFDS